MSELLFQVRGRTIAAAELPEHAEPAKPRVAKEREKQHLGFAVEGFAPGQIAEAHKHADEALRMWRAKSEEEQQDYLRAGNKEPKPWDEERYVRMTKPKRVAKLYSVPQAAADCMALAIAAGWERVRINELIRSAS